MKPLTLTHSQRRAILGLINGESMIRHAHTRGLHEKSVQLDLHRARKANSLTTYQLVARVAADLVRLEAGMR